MARPSRLEALKHYRNELISLGIDETEAEAEAKTAYAFVLECNLHSLYVKGQMPMTEAEEFRMNEIVRQRSTGKPLEYITGEKWFMGLRFTVNESVLIPRPETEQLTEEVINIMRISGYATALDLCTGSGCIGVSLARYTRAKVTASDISGDALSVCRKNAAENGTDICVVQSDLFENITDSFDVVISNPPYVSEREIPGLMREVRDFEPRMALLAADDGLEFYERITEDIAGHLNGGGLLAFEIGESQAEAVRELMKRAGLTDIRIQKDYSGRDRIALGIKPDTGKKWKKNLLK